MNTIIGQIQVAVNNYLWHILYQDATTKTPGRPSTWSAYAMRLEVRRETHGG